MNNKLKWIICTTCVGNGKVGHPALSNGFTWSEWSQLHMDEQAAYIVGQQALPYISLLQPSTLLAREPSALVASPHARTPPAKKIHR